MSFKLIFGFGIIFSSSGLHFRVRAGFEPELVGPFTTQGGDLTNKYLTPKRKIMAVENLTFGFVFTKTLKKNWFELMASLL